MPFLHVDEEMNTLPKARTLWPGHAACMAGAWAPSNYPLSQTEAGEFYGCLKSLSLAEIETMRLAACKASSELARREELAELARFAGFPERIGAFELARIQAQRALIWRWKLEEDFREIAELERECMRAGRDLLFGLDDLPLAEPDSAAPEVPDSMSALSWRVVIANAAFFIPPDLPILADEPMAAEIMETCRDQLVGIGGMRELRLEAPLWRILGHSRPARGLAESVYNVSRIWLVGKEADNESPIREA